MTFDRRSILGAGLGLGAAATAARANEKSSARLTAMNATAISPSLAPDDGRDQTSALQAAVDAAAEKDVPLVLPPGTFVVSDLRLHPGTRLVGAARATTIAYGGGEAFVTADKADGLVLEGITFDCAYKKFDTARGEGAVTLSRTKDLRLVDLDIRNSISIGLSLVECGGRINGVTISGALDAGLKSLDASGLDITGNTISDCGNNGILIWRSEEGEDGSVVSGNRISKIRNAAGGTGEYGNRHQCVSGGQRARHRQPHLGLRLYGRPRQTQLQIFRSLRIAANASARSRSMPNSASRAQSSQTTSSIPPRPASR